MPDLAALVDALKEGGYVFTEDTLVFGVQHLMPQTLGLCWALAELGISYDRIALCGKPYSTNLRVVEALRELGVLVGSPRAYELGKSQTEEQVEDLDCLGRDFSSLKSKFRNPAVIVIDDGGHALTRLDRFVSSPCTVTGVEQTASGFWQVGVRSVPFPIVDVGASAVKRVCEPALIVEAALCRALEYLPERSNIECGIVGMGFIGEAVAAALHDRGLPVTVYDVRPDAATASSTRRATSLRDLFDCSTLIFGCSGNDVTQDLIASAGPPLRPGRRTLISLSSGDVEFFALKSAILRAQGALTRTYDLDRIPNVTGAFQGTEFQIVRNGFPVNFDNVSQSVPLKKIQGTIAALIGAAAQAYSLTSGNAGNITQAARVMLDRSLQAWLYRRWQPVLGGEIDHQFDEHIVSISTYRTDPTSVDLGSSFPLSSKMLSGP
jgi:hypothetical protein